MENNSQEKAELKQISEKSIQQEPAENELNDAVNHGEAEKELNSRILQITMKIKDKYPELSKYIEEMPVTIPDEKHPEITLQNLKIYNDSLNSILNKYILEHPIT